MNIFDKCRDYVYADQLKEQGIYPYFKEIQGSEGPVVNMEGRKIIMAGSNNFLDLLPIRE